MKRIAAIQLYVISTGSMLLGTGAQSISFLIIARYLGKINYGQLATITAMTSLCSPWVQFGTLEAMRRRVARDSSEYRQTLGHCITIIFGFGSIVSVLFSLIASTLVKVIDNWGENFLIIGSFVVTNLVLYSWMSLVEQIYLAQGRIGRANITNAGFGTFRALIAAVACFGVGGGSIAHWAVWNFAAYFIASLVGFASIRQFGPPRIGIIWSELPKGVTFGIAGFFYSLRASIDILCLSAIAPPEVVGIYGLARRIVSIAIVTSSSLDRLIYARMVVEAKKGIANTFDLATKFAGYAIVISGFTALCMYILTPILLPVLFGETYRDASILVRHLSFLLMFIALQNVAFDALNSADLHKYQVTITSIAAIAGAAIVALLTRSFAIWGAVVGVYVLEASLAMALWIGLARLARPNAERHEMLRIVRSVASAFNI